MVTSASALTAQSTWTQKRGVYPCRTPDSQNQTGRLGMIRVKLTLPHIQTNAMLRLWHGGHVWRDQIMGSTLVQSIPGAMMVHALGNHLEGRVRGINILYQASPLINDCRVKVQDSEMLHWSDTKRPKDECYERRLGSTSPIISSNSPMDPNIASEIVCLQCLLAQSVIPDRDLWKYER